MKVSPTRLFASCLVALLAAAGTYALVEIGMLASDLRKTSEQIRQDAIDGHVLIGHTDAQLNGFAGTEEKHHSDKIEGLLPQGRDILRLGRIDAIALNKQEAAYYKSLNIKTEAVFGSAQSVLNMASGKLAGVDTPGISQDTRILLQALTTDANHAAALIDSLRGAIDDLDKVIGDPEIHKALVDLEQTAAGTQEFMVKLNAIMEDIRGKIHESTHPTKKRMALGYLLNSLKLVYYLSQIAK